MIWRAIWSTAIAGCVLGGLPGAAPAQDEPADEVTRQLFEQYVARQGKINTDSVLAATHLVAERGRRTGFWRHVLLELQRGKPESEIGCVRVLGKMLAIDAAARDAIQREKETGEVGAWVATIDLGLEVVAELIERGGKADRHRVDHYVIALARARVPEASEFFHSILAATDDRGPYDEPTARVAPGTAPAPRVTPATAPATRGRPLHSESTRFHAAVGLAQLGERAGIDWLIVHSEYNEGTVTNAWPKGTPPGGSLYRCCQEALRQLSGERALASPVEWGAWLASADLKSLRNRAVVFGDPW